MSYSIKVAQTAEKSLKKLTKKNKERIVEKIDDLAINPRPSDCKKLKGFRGEHLYRIRSGDYRIIYSINDDVLVILVVQIGHRKEIYR